MLQIKQEALALELGDDWNQKKISQLEQKESIDPVILQQVADVLKLPVAAFKNLDEDGAMNIINNTFSDFKDHATAALGAANTLNFNPVDKWVEALDEIKRLNELLLKEKDDKIKLLERWLGEQG